MEYHKLVEEEYIPLVSQRDLVPQLKEHIVLPLRCRECQLLVVVLVGDRLVGTR